MDINQIKLDNKFKLVEASAGLKDEKDRSSVILYMNESSDQPLPLP